MKRNLVILSYIGSAIVSIGIFVTFALGVDVVLDAIDDNPLAAWGTVLWFAGLAATINGARILARNRPPIAVIDLQGQADSGTGDDRALPPECLYCDYPPGSPLCWTCYANLKQQYREMVNNTQVMWLQAEIWRRQAHEEPSE